MNATTATKPLVLKVGGSFFEDKDAQQDFFAAISMLLAQDRKIVVVHGGGNQVQEQLQALGYQSTKHNGLRVTPKEHMPIVTGVLSGTLNKQLVSAAKQHAILAIGMSLADGDMCVCTQTDPKLGYVGSPSPLNDTMLTTLLNAHYMPVISSVGSNAQGDLLNVNADQAATCIAKLIDAELFLLSDVKGVLDGNKDLVNVLSCTLATQMISDNIITDGMIVKVEAAQEAATQLGRPVIVASWDAMSQIVTSKNSHVGTLVSPAKTSHKPIGKSSSDAASIA